MKSGEASETARRVAAHRLTFEREPTTYGDPDADERLARDVAGSGSMASSDSMLAYLAARTKFFDRLVVRALERGVEQVVIAAAGYDGRALRYAKPGVHWFEIDHPDTQADKRERLGRLGIETPHVTFVAADFATSGLAAEAAAAGCRTDAPSVFTCEGVAIYLERPVLESLLHELRTLAAPGSRLGISLSIESDSAALAIRRAAFRRAVAAMGEPARTVLRASEVDDLLGATGWQVLDSPGSTDRARRAGLLVLEPA